jgi:hypothetical protein
VLDGELKPTLLELRRVRTGALSPSEVAGPLKKYLGHGLGHLCDLLAAWIETNDLDRRGVDATLRFYGLSRMPESQRSIGNDLRNIWDRRGLSPRQVENLINETIERTEQRKPPFRINEAQWKITEFTDPFPPPVNGPMRLTARRIILWAWADAIDPPSLDGQAMLLYEFEHGLRKAGPDLDRDRKKKQRLRHRSWVMLDVARYRLSEAFPPDPIVNRSLGPRQNAFVELLPLEGAEALIIATLNPLASDIRAATEFVRASVRRGRPEAPELLGLLRDAISRSRNVPDDVISKVLALAAIVGRKSRDPAGLVAGDQALVHAQNVMNDSISARALSSLTVVLDALRAGHESAQLAFSIGDLVTARQLHRRTFRLLREFGDPEADIEPNGWEQLLLLYESSWLRRYAKLRRDPHRILEQADISAAISVAYVDDGKLPVDRGLNAHSGESGHSFRLNPDT